MILIFVGHKLKKEIININDFKKEKNIGLKLQKSIGKARLKSKGQKKERNIWLIDTWRMFKWRTSTHTWHRSQPNHQQKKIHESSNKIRSMSIIQGNDHTIKRREEETIYFMDTDQLNRLNQGPPKLILVWDKSLGFFLTRAQIIIYTNWPSF